MFEYFFISGTIFLVLSGALDEFRINKAVTCSVLALMLIFSALPDINIKHTIFFSPAGVFVFVTAATMFAIMKEEHYATVMYGVTTGLLVWAVITAVPNLNNWYLKAAAFTAAGIWLCETYFQGVVISVIACTVCDAFTLLLTVDLELVTLPVFIGESRKALIISFLLPIITIALLEKRREFMPVENVNEISS